MTVKDVLKRIYRVNEKTKYLKSNYEIYAFIMSAYTMNKEEEEELKYLLNLKGI